MTRILAIATASAAAIALLSVAAYWSIGAAESQAPFALPPSSPAPRVAPAQGAAQASLEGSAPQPPAVQTVPVLRTTGIPPSTPTAQPGITRSAASGVPAAPMLEQATAEPRAASGARFSAHRTGGNRSTQERPASPPRQTSAPAVGITREISTKPDAPITGAKATAIAQHDQTVLPEAQSDSSSADAAKSGLRQPRALTPEAAVAAIPQPPEQPSARRPRAWPKPFTPEEERLRQQIGVQAFINYQHELATGQKRAE